MTHAPIFFFNGPISVTPNSFLLVLQKICVSHYGPAHSVYHKPLTHKGKPHTNIMYSTK